MQGMSDTLTIWYLTSPVWRMLTMPSAFSQPEGRSPNDEIGSGEPPLHQPQTPAVLRETDSWSLGICESSTTKRNICRWITEDGAWEGSSLLLCLCEPDSKNIWYKLFARFCSPSFSYFWSVKGRIYQFCASYKSSYLQTCITEHKQGDEDPIKQCFQPWFTITIFMLFLKRRNAPSNIWRYDQGHLQETWTQRRESFLVILPGRLQHLPPMKDI